MWQHAREMSLLAFAQIGGALENVVGMGSCPQAANSTNTSAAMTPLPAPTPARRRHPGTSNTSAQLRATQPETDWILPAR